MPEPLDLDPIKARLAAAAKETDVLLGGLDDEDGLYIGHAADNAGDPMFSEGQVEFVHHAPSDIADLIAEVERLRREADCWRDATHHLSGKRG